MFNCQGGGWSREFRRNQCYSEYSKPISCKTGPKDVEWKNGHKPFPVEGVQCFAMYFCKEKKLVLSKPSDFIEISLDPFNYELIVVSPVTILPWDSIEFSPIGLVNMLNSGGAIKSFDIIEDKMVQVGVKGGGEMRVFASEKPKSCRVNGEDMEFEFEENMVKVQVPWNHNSPGFSTIDYLF